MLVGEKISCRFTDLNENKIFTLFKELFFDERAEMLYVENDTIISVRPGTTIEEIWELLDMPKVECLKKSFDKVKLTVEKIYDYDEEALFIALE